MLLCAVPCTELDQSTGGKKRSRTPYPLHAPAPARGGATRDFIYMQQTRRKCGNIKIVLKNLLKILIFKDIFI